jgi:hypothetical protein
MGNWKNRKRTNRIGRKSNLKSQRDRYQKSSPKENPVSI